MMRLLTILFIACLVPGSVALADWEANPADKVQVAAASAIEAFQQRIPRTEPFFEQAYGYAIYPSVTRVGLGFGGAYGRGIVVHGDAVVGTSKYWQFTSGIQAGARNFSMIVFFKDKEALEYFQSGNTQFMGQAGLAFATVGVAGTPGYNDGVAVVTMTRFGLMGEFTISGARYSYEPGVGD